MVRTRKAYNKRRPGGGRPGPVRLPVRGPAVAGRGEGSGVNRGPREHRGSFRGYPKQGGGAVFSWLLSPESGQSPPLHYPP